MNHMMGIKFLNDMIKEAYNTKKDQTIQRSDYKLLCENMRFRHYKAGETIFEFGDYGDQFFIILKGTVSVLVPKQNEKGNIKRKQITRSKTFVKESSNALTKPPSPRDAEEDFNTKQFEEMLIEKFNEVDKLMRKKKLSKGGTIDLEEKKSDTQKVFERQTTLSKVTRMGTMMSIPSRRMSVTDQESKRPTVNEKTKKLEVKIQEDISIVSEVSDGESSDISYFSKEEGDKAKVKVLSEDGLKRAKTIAMRRMNRINETNELAA